MDDLLGVIWIFCGRVVDVVILLWFYVEFDLWCVGGILDEKWM